MILLTFVKHFSLTIEAKIMDTLSIKFYLNKNSIKGNRQKIYCRLLINRKKSEFATNHYIDPEKWDSAKQQPISCILIQQDIAEIENKIFTIRRDLLDREIKPTAKIIIDILKGDGRSRNRIDLITFYEQQFKEMKDKGESAESTIRHYSGTLKILAMYFEYAKQKPIKIAEVDYKFVKDLDYYLSAVYISPYDKKLQRNTINKHHARVRAIINSAVVEDLVSLNPYRKYKFKYTKSEREYLTEEELLAIEELYLEKNLRLDRIRDIFLFTCNTGIRFQDAQDLTVANIKTTRDGKLYLKLKMTKTSEFISIPLTKQASSIISKYVNHKSRITYGKLLPEISNQKFNKNIKVIGLAAGLDKKISHHIARHTFATLALNKGISIVVVQQLLGHTTVGTTEIYAKVIEKTIFNEMEKFEQ